ncbi:hypothetical protein GCM10010924_39880 [Rhizobium wenxiniae]|nr:hypothetical protein GCM10010924_39880 [Rhizobium wenxiniae]
MVGILGIAHGNLLMSRRPTAGLQEPDFRQLVPYFEAHGTCITPERAAPESSGISEFRPQAALPTQAFTTQARGGVR